MRGGGIAELRSMLASMQSHDPDYQIHGGPRHQRFSIQGRSPLGEIIKLVLLSAIFVLGHAQDPFTSANDPFASGWKQVTSAPVVGVFISSDGRSGITWGPSGFQITKDRGISWSNPIIPGAFTGSPNAPIISGTVGICEAVVAGQDAYVRSFDGVVRGVDGAPRNQAWGIQAISRIAVAGNGILFAESADGKATIAVVDGTKIGTAPGRLIFSFEKSVATFDGTQGHYFDGLNSHPIRIQSLDNRPPAVFPMATGPGTEVQRGSDGTRWTLSVDKLECIGRSMQPVTVLSYGPGKTKDNGTLIGVIKSEKYGTVIVSARDNDGLKQNEATTEAPSDLTAVAGLGMDPNGNSRFRVIAATPRGLMMYRSP